MRNVPKACSRAVVVLSLAFAGMAAAAPFQVTVDTTPLEGMTGHLAFDLIDGGPPANTITIYDFASDGMLLATSIANTGGAAGTLPATVTLSDTDFFNEYLQAFKFGTILSFIFDSTGNPAEAGSFPDTFSLFFLDDDALASLVSTADGSGALLAFDVGEANPFQPIQILSSITVDIGPAVNGVPEPGVPGLLVLSLALVIILRRRTSPAQRNAMAR